MRTVVKQPPPSFFAPQPAPSAAKSRFMSQPRFELRPPCAGIVPHEVLEVREVLEVLEGNASLEHIEHLEHLAP